MSEPTGPNGPPGFDEPTGAERQLNAMRALDARPPPRWRPGWAIRAPSSSGSWSPTIARRWPPQKAP
jgi:hypothetical protein